MRDDLGDIGTRISSLSGNMKAVLANAVDSVASPIDEFTSDSEIVTGDLSNLKKSFDTRFVKYKFFLKPKLLPPTVHCLFRWDLPDAILLKKFHVNC